MKVTDSTTPSVSSKQTPSRPASIENGSAPKLAGEVRDLICFSHLRWNFVYQRPQHLLERAAKNYRVWFIEEPIWDKEMRMNVCKQTDRLTILVPHLPHGTSPEEAIRLQRQLLDEFIERERVNEFIAWYYTPMALLFSGHLKPRLTIYDCMDELSAFWGALHNC